MPQNPNCTRCQLHLTTKKVCIWGYGKETARIMLVGEAPGAEEEKEGRPFVGAAGRVLDNCLSAAGLTRDDVYITNVNRCRPPGNRTPHLNEINACLPYLLEEIEAIRPDVIVPLGNTALTALTGKKAISKERGRIIPAKNGLRTESRIVATFHPAAALHSSYGGVVKNANIRESIEQDFRFIVSLLRQEKRDDSHARFVLPDDDGTALLKELESCRVIACDLEWTAGTDSMIWPWTNAGEAFSLAFSGRINGEVRSVAVAWPPSPETNEALRSLLQRPLIFHNAMADWLWLRSLYEKSSVSLAADTMLLGYLLDETQSHSLESMAGRYAALAPDWKGGTRSTRPDSETEWRELLTYNANDARATLLLFEALAETIKKLPNAEAIVRLHRQLLIPAIDALGEAAFIGVPFDEEQVDHHYDRLVGERENIVEELSQLTALTPPQAQKLAGSPDRIKKYLHSTFNIDVDSTEKSQLSQLARYPVVKSLLRYRSNEKLLTTYIEPWRTMLKRQGDGRIHTIYRVAGTRTGRLSSEAEIGGPLQVTPREKWVRELIRAKPGRLIVSADYSQIELKMIAWLAPEPTLRRFYAEDRDVHSATAAFILAVGEGHFDPSLVDAYLPRVTKLLRQAAKGVNFGLAFGMQQAKLASYSKEKYDVDMTEEQSRLAHRAYHTLYSGLEPWHRRAMQDAERLGYTETPFGRRRTFNGDADTHKAINTPIQSTASDLTLLAMIQADKAILSEQLDAVIIGFVHDSILIDVSERDSQQTAELLRYAMENVDTSAFGFTIPVPLIAETKIEEVWS